jgi:lysine-N-methylase
VPIDQAAYEKYRNLPPSPLRTKIDASILLSPKGEADSEVNENSAFAQIRMNDSNQCPMLTEDRLCRIHAELGEGMLSHACSTYPRIVRGCGGVDQKSLTLSCPEAARLVLLAPELLTAGQPEKHATGANEALAPDKDEDSRPPNFRAIRKVVLALVRNRIYPLWQRLFLLDVLCRRLDSIAKGELKRSIPDFLRDFENTVATGTLRTAMDTLPLDREAQLDVVLRLAGLLLHRSNIHPRFVECVHAFTAGIGNAPGATLQSLTARYSLAHDRFYEPFFRRQPHIVENYLINTIVRSQFPFGHEGMSANAHDQPSHALPEMTREFALLATQFALMKGLLIGVAGFHGEAFSAAHAVHTIQAASKHFEHHPEFLKMSHVLLVESRMDGARGLAILLRNSGPGIASNNPGPIPSAIHTLESRAREPKL